MIQNVTQTFLSSTKIASAVCSAVLALLVLCPVTGRAQEPALPVEEKPMEQKESDLDKFDDFFGDEKSKEPNEAAADDKKKENKEEKSEEAGNEKIIDQAVPMIMIQPAVRVEVGAVAVEGVVAVDGEMVGQAVVEGEDEIVDPNTSRLARVLKVEIAFIRRCCQLTEEQEAELAKLDTKWVAKQLETAEGKKANKKLVVDPFSGGMVSSQKYQEAVDVLAQPFLKTILTQEQFDAYQLEAKARSEFARQSEIDATVAIIDHHLMLTEKQYPLVREAVSKMAVLPQEPLNYLRYGQYIPSMSLTSILKHLTKFQRKLLQGLQQVQFGVSHEENPEIIER